MYFRIIGTTLVRARSLGVMLAAGSLALLGVAWVAPSHAMGPPFDPDQASVLIAQAEPAPGCPGGTGTQLFRGLQIEDADENVTVEYNEIGPISCVQYNSIGFDAVDGYVHGVASNSYGGVVVNEIVRIDADGTVTGTGVVLPVSDSGRPYNIGVYVPLSPTSGELVVAAGCGVGTASYITVPLSGGGAGTPDAVGPPVSHPFTRGANMPAGAPIVPNLADWVYLDGYLWGFSTNTNNTPSGLYLYRLDPSNGELSRTPLPAGFNGIGTSSFGGQWVYGNGNIGLSDNVTGMLFQVRLVDADGKAYTGGSAMPSVQFVGESIQGVTVTGLIMKSSGNDATSTPGLPVDLALTKSVSVGDGASGTAGSFWSLDGPVDVTYTLVVTNDSVHNVSSGWILDDPLPDGVTITGFAVDSTAASSGASCHITSSAVTCAGSQGLKPSESITITLTGTVSGSDLVTNVATVTGNDKDPDPDNNTGQAELTPTDDPPDGPGDSGDQGDDSPAGDDQDPPVDPPADDPQTITLSKVAHTGGSVEVSPGHNVGLTALASAILLAGCVMVVALPRVCRRETK